MNSSVSDLRPSMEHAVYVIISSQSGLTIARSNREKLISLRGLEQAPSAPMA